MRGTLRIERENTDGDRLIVDSVDIEGQLQGTDALEVAKARADLEFAEGAVYRMRIFHELYGYRCLASKIIGRDWRTRA